MLAVGKVASSHEEEINGGLHWSDKLISFWLHTLGKFFFKFSNCHLQPQPTMTLVTALQAVSQSDFTKPRGATKGFFTSLMKL